MGLRSRERRDQHLRARRPCGTPLLQLSADHVLGTRQAQAVHLADNGIAGDSDLAGDLAARKAGMKATLQQLDALRTPGRTIRGHVDGGLAGHLWRAEMIGCGCRRRGVTKLWLTTG